MKEFSYLSYYTEYSCEGSFNKRMNSEPCFSYVFSHVSNNSNVVYKVILYLGTEFVAKKHASNACLLSKEELYRHINLLKSLYPFKFSIADYSNEFFTRVIVTLEIKEVPAMFHKYALTWLRYAYEYPYNVLLRDTYILKKDPTFRFESIANLFNLVLGCYCEETRVIHQIPYNQVNTRMKLAQVRDRIKMVKELNDIYTKSKYTRTLIPTSIGGYSPTDIDYWDNGFDERKPIYMNVYETIKK